MHDETFLYEDRIFESHTTPYDFIFHSLLATRICETYLAKFHIKMCYIIYQENDYYYSYYLKTHANSSPTVFYIAVGHIDLLLRI